MKKLFFIFILFLSSTSRSEDWIEVQNDLSTGRYSNALERINQIQEKDFDFYTYKGLALELMGNLEEADLNYKLALEQNSTEWIYVQRVRLLLKLKKEKEAAIILENGRKKYPNSQNLLNLKDDISNKRNERYVQYHYQSAINYINLKKYDLARDELKKALNKGNNYYEIYQLFGYLDLLEKQYPSAILEYKKSIALRNNDPNLYLALYQVYSLNEQEDKAINSLIESLKYDSNNISILNRIAYYFELQSSLETAELYYKKSLDLDSSDTFAKEGIKRIQHQQMTEFYMEYSSSRGKDRELNPGIQGNRINIRSYFLSMSKKLTSNFKLGFSYKNEEEEKESGIFHSIDQNKFLANLTWTKNKAVLSASLESALYEAKDIGSGTSGTNDYINGTILASYSLKSHQLSFLTMKTTFVEDINTALEVEKLSMFLFQDLWEINSNWSFLSRYIIGISKDIDYDYISVAPSYKFSGIKGLSSRLELAYVSSDDIDNYFQESVGILLEKSISPTLDFSADTEIGYRQRDYSVFVDSKLVFATSIFKSFTPFLTLEYLKHFSDESERNLSYQLGLRTFF